MFTTLNLGQSSSHTPSDRDGSPIKLDLPEGIVSLPREANGSIICHCSHKKCPRPFESIKGLKKHLRVTKMAWQGPPYPIPRGSTSISFSQASVDFFFQRVIFV
jgi:hypothetical protein